MAIIILWAEQRTEGPGIDDRKPAKKAQLADKIFTNH
jgi:hypothetical protein